MILAIKLEDTTQKHLKDTEPPTPKKKTKKKPN